MFSRSAFTSKAPTSSSSYSAVISKTLTSSTSRSAATSKSIDMMPELFTYYSKGINFTKKAGRGMIQELWVMNINEQPSQRSQHHFFIKGKITYLQISKTLTSSTSRSAATSKSIDMMPELFTYYSKGINFTKKAGRGMIQELWVMNINEQPSQRSQHHFFIKGKITYLQINSLWVDTSLLLLLLHYIILLLYYSTLLNTTTLF